MLILLFVLSLILNVFLVFLLIRFARRSLEFDLLFDVIADDFDVGIKFFDDVLSRPTFTNSTELNVISRNINVLRDRMMVNANNIRLLKPKTEKKRIDPRKNHQRPVVVD